ncbi:hypothetical protein ACJMK2_037102 [Sinanodonta woodiana]|uniref:Uncharacterized protein n=1 Tax=Sinanodonta woodiana TaxID=1069815 RepID=A0ABD3WMT6_SINWO
MSLDKYRYLLQTESLRSTTICCHILSGQLASVARISQTSYLPLTESERLTTFCCQNLSVQLHSAARTSKARYLLVESLRPATFCRKNYTGSCLQLLQCCRPTAAYWQNFIGQNTIYWQNLSCQLPFGAILLQANYLLLTESLRPASYF